jgi:hypothetical protein
MLAEDWAALKTEAHRLKGTSGYKYILIEVTLQLINS